MMFWTVSQPGLYLSGLHSSRCYFPVYILACLPLHMNVSVVIILTSHLCTFLQICSVSFANYLLLTSAIGIAPCGKLVAAHTGCLLPGCTEEYSKAMAAEAHQHDSVQHCTSKGFKSGLETDQSHQLPAGHEASHFLFLWGQNLGKRCQHCMEDTGDNPHDHPRVPAHQGQEVRDFSF